MPKKRTHTPSLAQRYRGLEPQTGLPIEKEDKIRPELLITFPYEHPRQPAEILIETQEFSAVCPWTGLPDQGTLRIEYSPKSSLLELKSLKFYLLRFRQVGIIQEHAAARILADLVKAVRPRSMVVSLDYLVRGGIHTVVTVRHT